MRKDSAEGIWYPLCPMKHFYETSRLDEFWVSRYCHGDWSRCVRYQMEKAGESHPDWMLPDGRLDDRLRGTKKNDNR